MADANQAVPGAPSGGSNKIVFGLLGLNMVVIIAVAVILMMGQKKQAQQQTLDQVAAGHAEAGAGHGAAAAGGENAGGGEHGGAAKDEKSAEASEVRFFNVGNFTANLAGPASTHYIALDVSFEIAKDADEEEFKQRAPQFRDRVISLLNSKKPAELQSVEGRGYLKEEIKTVVNGLVKKGKVEGVYFSKFVIN